MNNYRNIEINKISSRVLEEKSEFRKLNKKEYGSRLGINNQSLDIRSFNEDKGEIEITPELKHSLNQKITDLKLKLKHKFSLGFSSVLSIFCLRCFSSKNKKSYLYYKIATTKLTHYLDYLKIIKTLQEFRKLKKVLLSKSQRILFSASTIPTIDEKKINSYKEKKYDYDGEVKEYCEIYKSYISLKKDSFSKKNKKLVENLDNDLKIIFDQFELEK